MTRITIIIPFVLFCWKNKELLAPDILTITVPETIVHAGESAVIKIQVDIKKGYHIQASKVKDESLIPTTLKIAENKNITTGNAKFPPAVKFRLEGTDDALDVYDGNVEIKVPFKTNKKKSKGNHVLNASLHYQACDDRRCFFPKTIEFSLPIKII